MLAPGGHVRGKTETEKAQGGLGDDDPPQIDGEYDDQGCHQVGQHVGADGPAPARADRLGRRYVLVLLDDHDGTSGYPRVADTAQNPQDDDDLQRALAEHGHHRDEHQQARERHPGVDHPLRKQVELAADIAGHAEQRRHHHADRGARQADDHRGPSAEDDPTQNVASQVVGTQEVFPRRRCQPVGQVEVVHPVGSQEVREDADEQHQQDDGAGNSAQRLLPPQPGKELEQR